VVAEVAEVVVVVVPQQAPVQVQAAEAVEVEEAVVLAPAQVQARVLV